MMTIIRQSLTVISIMIMAITCYSTYAEDFNDMTVTLKVQNKTMANRQEPGELIFILGIPVFDPLKHLPPPNCIITQIPYVPDKQEQLGAAIKTPPTGDFSIPILYGYKKGSQSELNIKNFLTIKNDKGIPYSRVCHDSGHNLKFEIISSIKEHLCCSELEISVTVTDLLR